MDGEVHFFPSTKGLLEFDEIVEFRRAGGLLQNQNESRVRATSQQNQKSQFLVQGEMASPSLIPPPILGFNVKAAHALEPIQKLVDEATRLVAQGSKLKSGVLEFLQSKDLNNEATTPEQIALHMLKVQSDGYIASLEMTQRLMEALKKYEVECKDRPALENCSINYKQEAMHQCHQAD
nr:disease resistance protein TAO1-like [Ipomoea batatas]